MGKLFSVSSKSRPDLRGFEEDAETARYKNYYVFSLSRPGGGVDFGGLWRRRS